MEQLVMLIGCDIPFSPKHFFPPPFLFIQVSMAFLKETALLNSTNTGGVEWVWGLVEEEGTGRG